MRKKGVIGDFLKIELGDGFHAYARLLDGSNFAFYNKRANCDIPLDEIKNMEIAFTIAVMGDAVKGGGWSVIGNVPLDEKLKTIPPKFTQDIFDKNKFRIFENGEFRSATKAECEGLERSAVWSRVHVEDRLRDYFSGLENKWVKSLSIK